MTTTASNLAATAGGSIGFGREYRERLDDNRGIVDVDDCVNGARHLAERGLVDGARSVINGGRAGGYTVLAALTFRDYFRGGASHCGISDLAVMARGTHKFESRYVDSLVGPYPEREDVYRERSPIFHAHRLAVPVIFFQGYEDLVVPQKQARNDDGPTAQEGNAGRPPAVFRRAARLPQIGQHQAIAR